jgi:hypothetical protein
MMMKQYITKGWPIAKKMKGAVMIYNRCKDELRFEEVVIWRIDRIVVPMRFGSKYVNEIHYGHSDVKYTLQRAREYMFWPIMSQISIKAIP